MSAKASAFRASIPPIAKERIIYHAAIGAVVLGCLSWLVFGPRPSEAGIAAAVEAGRSVKSVHFAVTGSWYGSIAVLVLAVGLLACGRWVLRPLNASFTPKDAGIPPKSRPVFVGFTLAAMILGGVINYPRLSSSLWGDEEQTVKRMVVGSYERSENGLGEELKFRPATWIDTFFRYKTPNNHVLNSVLARTSHVLFFRKSDAPEALHFSGTVIRLPAFCAGLAGIAALGWCVAVLGFPRSGIMSMFLLAVHPWFTRYGVDARGYAFVFLFFPLSLGFMVKALRSGSWRHFLLFALAELLLFVAYAGAIYLLVPLNLAGGLAIVFGKGDRAARTTLASRFVAANAAATMAVTALMTPCLLQLHRYFETHDAVYEITAAWVADNLSYIVAGIPWKSWHSDNPLAHSLSTFPPFSVWLLLSTSVVLFALGIVRLARSSRQTFILAIALVLPWPLFFLHTLSRNPIIYHWYTSTSLPGIVIVISLGLEAIPARLANVRMRDALGLLFLLVVAGSYAWFTTPQRNTLRTHSVEPLRESVAVTRRVVNPEHPDIDSEITVGFCMATRGYDPAAYLFKDDDPDAFKALLDRARSENKPLHVNFALRGLAQLHFPKMMEIIENPEIFEFLPPFWGLEQPATRLVYRLK